MKFGPKASTIKQSSKVIEQWTQETVKGIDVVLESPNWAPCLAAVMPSLEGRITTFQGGQFLLKEGDELLIKKSVKSKGFDEWKLQRSQNVCLIKQLI